MPKIDLKITIQLTQTDDVSSIDSVVTAIMQGYPKCKLAHQGTMMTTLHRDWIYVVPKVKNDVELLDVLKPKLVAALGRNVVVESLKYRDAYPGDASMWGYVPGALVLNRR